RACRADPSIACAGRMTPSFVNRARDRQLLEEVMRSRSAFGAVLWFVLSVVGAGGAAANSECEDKCEKSYKGMAWWIANCKKTTCQAADANKAAEDLKKHVPALLLPPTDSCSAQCEKNYAGKAWWIDKCKKDRKCAAPPAPPAPAAPSSGTAGA